MRVLLLVLLFSLGCPARSASGDGAPPPDRWAEARVRMVERQMQFPPDGRTAITDKRVLRAMKRVPRHLFVPEAHRGEAYADTPLPIGHDQTISQPYIVALMTELLAPGAKDVVLEVGTGSGYQAAVLAELVERVYTIEIVEPLAERAKRDLQAAGYDKVTVRAGDGYLGWPEHAPFDGILVTAAPDHVPEPLVRQLKKGGRLVLPVGPQGFQGQELVVLEKQEDGTLKRASVLPVRFVPLTGDHAKGAKPPRE